MAWLTSSLMLLWSRWSFSATILRTPLTVTPSSAAQRKRKRVDSVACECMAAIQLTTELFNCQRHAEA
jgi:hypothetical protein